ncbi:MAG: DUF6776 family protein [Lysobacterales bacterium]
MKLSSLSMLTQGGVVLRAYNPGRSRRRWLLLAALWLMTLAAAWLIASYYAAPRLRTLESEMAQARKQLADLQRDLQEARRKLSFSEKSEQVAGTANKSLQATLRANQEEIASLRNDIGFYQRLMEGKAGRKGLTIQSLGLSPIAGGRGFDLRATLTQNLRKGELTSGNAELHIEGMQGGNLVSLDWTQLPDRQPADALVFSFKYFQQLSASFLLPEGFTPNRIKLRVTSKQGDDNALDLAWAEAIGNGVDGSILQ